ncbi:MAG: hypothetical protein U0T84_06535 [Chitinophagales bacterium]
MKYFTFLLYIHVSILVWAQSAPMQHPRFNNHESTERAAPKRLVSGSDYSFDGTNYNLEDTTIYGWRADNGSGLYYDTVTNYALSGTTLVPVTRTLYRFDTNHMLSYQGDQEWQSGSSAWRTIYEEDRIYSDTLLVHLVARNWSSAANSLRNLRLEEYRFYPDHSPMSARLSSWDSVANTWIIYSLDSETYSAGQIQLKQSWIGDNHGGLIRKFQSTFQYTTGHVITTYQDWDTVANSWLNANKFDDQYSGGLMTQSLYQTWDSAVQQWKNSGLKTLQYSGNLVTDRLEKTWNTVSSNWENYWHTTYQYTGNQVAVEVAEQWNNNQWQKSLRATSSYNTNGDLILNITESGVQPGNTWKFSFKDTSAYDAEGYYTGYIPYIWESSSSAWKPSPYSYANYFFYAPYDPGVGITTDIFNTNCSLFPIPTNNQLMVRFEAPKASMVTFTISNLTGGISLQHQQFLTAGEHLTSFDVSHLPSGCYQLEVLSDRGFRFMNRWVKP